MLSALRLEDDDERPTARWSPVFESLRDAIVGHKLAPGTKLPEDELASIYSVSRTVIRAALQALAHDRLVRLEPNRGAFVAQPSKKEAREVFEARALIEPKVAALAANAAKPEDIALLRRHLEKEHEALHAGRDSEAILLSARFHVGIAEIADHSILTDFVRDLVSHSSLIIALYWKRRDTTCESHAHHALIDAIEAGRAAEAAELMKSHMVDLLSGLDLSRGENVPEKLADILR
ncbi:GntR family transcriptional regulator [Mesorhizobium sp. SB112]|uniref:GntR family transcriptional regulator n=1 Tax=Mesorhizobium sp. SB112 TaxID=3151853 RepID=UPI0032671BEC